MEPWRSKLVVDHSRIVHSIANEMCQRMPDSVEHDELVGVGFVGLTEAAGRFDPDVGTPFVTFAWSRVKGEMFDHMRRSDKLGRYDRQHHREILKARTALAERLGHGPTDTEVATELGWTVRKVRYVGRKIASEHRVSMNQPLAHCDNREPLFVSDVIADPDLDIDLVDDRLSLEAELPTLSERERLVIGLIYWRGWTLKMVGDELGVTESRISQIHRVVLNRLHDRMQVVA